jgi:dUTP pyrophosphatase
MEWCVYVNKLDPSFELPSYGTSLSSCFDLKFQAKLNDEISAVNSSNTPFKIYIEPGPNPSVSHRIYLGPGERALLPTGLIFKLESTEAIQTYSIRLHPRSSVAFKRGLSLANCEGVVDVDYQEQVYIPIINNSSIVQAIELGERICQGELVENKIVRFLEVPQKLTRFSERTGGFGSTGRM